MPIVVLMLNNTVNHLEIEFLVNPLDDEDLKVRRAYNL